MAASRILMIPRDKESAKCILNTFNERAHSIVYQKIYEQATCMVYGPHFIIKQDLNKRMYFKCTICNKDMNNTRSLVDHIRSGSHIKNVNSSRAGKINQILPVVNAKKLQPNDEGSTLKEMVDCPGLRILGLQKVEHFKDGSRSYYKCCLCNVHGNCEVMYNHLTGEKHTDSYIRHKLKLKCPNITAEEREYLQADIYSKENYTGTHIVTILGKQYFPYFLIDKGGDVSFDDLSTSKIYYHCANGEAKVETVNSYVQTDFTNEFYEDILTKFAFIVHTDKFRQTMLVTADDLRFTVIVMVFALHLLFYVNDSFLRQDVNICHHENQKNLIEGCLGHVIMKLGKIFKNKYPYLKLKLN